MKRRISYLLIFIFSLNSILNNSFTNNTNYIKAAETSSGTSIIENASGASIENNKSLSNSSESTNTDEENAENNGKINNNNNANNEDSNGNENSDNDMGENTSQADSDDEQNTSDPSLDPENPTGSAIEEGEEIQYDIEFTQAELTENDDAFYNCLQNAFNIAKETATDDKPFNIHVPNGNYHLSNMLKIYSNTTLVLDSNAKVVTDGSDDNSMRIMLVNGNYNGASVTDDEYNGYGTYRNITIQGGIWDGNAKNYSGTNKPILFRFAHATNLNIKNAIFQNNKGNHHIEAAAIDGFNVVNCTFRQTTPNNDGTDVYLEALQIDISTESYPSFMSDAQKSDGSGYDNLPCKNVLVSGCSFQNLFRGIGTHHPGINELSDQDIYYENITIKNNKFVNISDANIIGRFWKNAVIQNNVIDDKVNLKKSGITLEYCTDSTVTNNTIYNSDEQAIYISNGSAKSVSNNKIYYSHNYGIYLYNTTVENVNTNTIKSCQGQGLKLLESTVKNNIYKNSISQCQAQGIDITNSIVVKAITDNIVQNNQITQITINTQNDGSSHANGIINNTINGGSYGIVVGQNVDVTYIYGNEISENYQNGISLNKCNVTSVGVEKSGNKITGCGNVGISVTNGAVAKNITKNNITDPAVNGIALSESGSHVENISSNTIKSSGSSSISINKPAFVSNSISNNTITSSGDCGIYTNSTISKSISDNTITSPLRQAIKTVSASIESITDNRITGGTIGIYSENGDIKYMNNNNISSISGNGFSIKNIKTLKDFNSNYIDNTEQDSIYLVDCSVENPIGNNTIKCSKKNGIYMNNSSASIEENTISSCKFQGIYTLNSKIATLNSNKFTGGQNGILLSNGSVDKINKNTITSPDESGIVVSAVSSIGQISGNTIKNPGANGIYVYSSTTTSLKNNEIKKAGMHGISVSLSTVSNLKKNTINKTDKNGININKSKISKFTSNQVKKAGTVGYAIANNSNIVSTSDNTCSGSKKIISLSKNSKGLFFINQTIASALAEYPFNAPKPVYSSAMGKITISQKTATNQKPYLSIKKNGQVLLKKAGVATLVYNQNGVSTTQTIKVQASPKKVYVKKKKLKLKVGKTYTIKPWVSKKTKCPKYTFKSNKKKIVKVDKKGLLTAKKKGKATITVKTYNGKSVKIKVTVKEK